MEKKYGYYMTKSEKVLLVIVFLLIAAGIVWMISQHKYYLFLAFLGPLITFFTYPFSYRLTTDNMLDVRNLLGNLTKPVSVNQITRVTQKSKNEAILVYNRDGLRGDRILRLSETDMKDFVDELKKRNPIIEFSLI